MMKRAVDIIVSILGLIVLAPVFGLLWALIRFNLGAPVVVSQQRPGRDGELFGCCSSAPRSNMTRSC